MDDSAEATDNLITGDVGKENGYDEKRKKSIRAITQLSCCAGLVHFIFMVASVVLWGMGANGHNTRYDLSRSVFINSATLINATQTELTKTCPLTKFELLTSRADFNVSGRGGLLGTWISTKTKILNTFNVDGYGLLFTIYFISCIAQIKVVLECRRAEASKENTRYAFFEGPCAARWLEYAFTSPCQIVIISCCLLIRDVYTTILLALAQGALVQFGYALECAFELRVVETEAIEVNEPANKKIPPLGFLHRDDTVDPLPMVPFLHRVLNPRMSINLWWWSFVPSTLLHIAIWGILFSSFDEQIETRCREDDAQMPKWIHAILITQFLLFTCFMVVAVVQSWVLRIIPIPFVKRPQVTSMQVKDVFVQAFFWYTFFSLTAKALLGGVYMGYVATFPFSTE